MVTSMALCAHANCDCLPLVSGSTAGHTTIGWSISSEPGNGDYATFWKAIV